MFSSVRSRLGLVLVLATLPPATVLAYTAREWHSHELDDARDTAVLLTRHFAEGYAQEVDDAEHMLATVAQLAAVYKDDDRLMRALEAELRVAPRYLTLGAVRPGNRVVLAGMPLPPVLGEAERPLFRRARDTGGLTAGERLFDAGTEQMATLFVLPSGGPAPQQTLVFAARDFAWVHAVGDLAPLLPADALVLVFDLAGVLVARSPQAAGHVGRRAHGAEVVTTALRTRGEGTVESSDLDGVARIFAYTPLRGGVETGELFLAIGLSKGEAAAAADRLLRQAFLFFALAVALGVALGGIASDSLLLRPVRGVIDATRRLAEGDLSAKLEVQHAPAELGQLVQSVNALASALREWEQGRARQQEKTTAELRSFRMLVDHASYGMALLDDRCVIAFISVPAARLFGARVSDLLGRALVSLVHPDDQTQLQTTLRGLSGGPQTTTVATFQVRGHAGTWRRLDARFLNLIGDPRVGAIAMTCRHAGAEGSDEPWAEQAVQKLSLAIEQTEDSVMITDRNGVIQYVNPAFERMTGHAREEVVGQKPRFLQSGIHDDAFYQRLWRTIHSGRSFRATFTNRTRQGELYEVEETITPIIDSTGNISHFVSTGRDITQHRRTQEALRRLNRQLEDQAARIAGVLHDEAGQFLTAAHLVLADLARELDAPGRDRVQEIRRQLDAVEERLRGISREIHPSVVTDLGLSEAVRVLAASFSRRTGVRITVNSSLADRYTDALEVVVYRLVQEALTNVARHARATCAAVELAANDASLSCVIRDDGVGFDPGARGATGEQSLGLRLMQDRVEAVGGTLTVTSAPGQGTEIRALLPMET